jgi:hypothetical protein
MTSSTVGVAGFIFDINGTGARVHLLFIL